MEQVLIAAGVVNGGLIGLVLLYRGLTGRNGSVLLGGLLVLIGVLAAAVIPTPGIKAFEVLLLLLSGPLLVLLTGRLTARSPHLWRLVPAAAAAGLAVWTIERTWGGDPVRPAALAQMAFTAWAWALFARSSARARPDRRRRTHGQGRVALALLIGFTAVHAAQLLRLGLPGNDLLRPLVPLTLALVFTAATVIAAVHLLSPQRLAPLDAPAEANAEAGEGRALAGLRNWLEQDRRWADPSIRLADALAALDMDPSGAAHAVRAAGHAGLPDYLQAMRLDHARTQLADPAEARTSIEAIGLGCGFRSRSTFYAAFERQTGLSPGAYRARALAKTLSG